MALFSLLRRHSYMIHTYYELPPVIIIFIIIYNTYIHTHLKPLQF